MNVQYDKANMFDVLHHKKVIYFVQGASYEKTTVHLDFLTIYMQSFCVEDFYSPQLKFR